MPVMAKHPTHQPREMSSAYDDELGEPERGTINVGPVDRILRILLGGLLAVWALTRLIDHGRGAVWLFDLALVALGVDFVVTGIRGYCPLYARLGWNTAYAHTAQ